MDLVKESAMILSEMFQRTIGDIGVAAIIHEMDLYKIYCERRKEVRIKNAKRLCRE